MFQIPAEGSDQITAVEADDWSDSFTWSSGQAVVVQHVDMDAETVFCRIEGTGNYLTVPLDGGLEGFKWIEEED